MLYEYILLFSFQLYRIALLIRALYKIIIIIIIINLEADRNDRLRNKQTNR